MTEILSRALAVVMALVGSSVCALVVNFIYQNMRHWNDVWAAITAPIFVFGAVMCAVCLSYAVAVIFVEASDDDDGGNA